MKLHTMFYNFQYNYGHEQGQSKFVWGISDFDLEKPLVPQMIAKTGFDESKIFNPNLTAFNPVIIEQAKAGE
ncbi:MAG: hypothetical protein ACKO7M_03695 [Acinetobacter junii]